MIEAVIIALIIAKIKGYSLKPFFKSWTIYPILIFEAIYIVFQMSIFMGNYDVIKWAPWFKSIYMYLFLIPIFWYKEYVSALIGSLFILVGTFLNHIVMAANGGEMPVFPSLSYLTGYLKPNTISKVNDIHMIGTSTVKYKYLSDIIDIGYSVLSIGDILIRVFVVIIIYVTVKKTNEKNEYKQRNIFA
ncbi:DUF5317 domain-containing protein [Clostridium perfringens]|uniref:DUF5317 domain-containing protein n=1 Tax=Clostridium perfringens TaxID=1502 RepID=UPI000F53CB92|nr:DUF5317 domain-containing protein [Clostridium perfringens]